MIFASPSCKRFSALNQMNKKPPSRAEAVVAKMLEVIYALGARKQHIENPIGAESVA